MSPDYKINVIISMYQASFKKSTILMNKIKIVDK